jgi:hypothetical protein
MGQAQPHADPAAEQENLTQTRGFCRVRGHFLQRSSFIHCYRNALQVGR